MSEYTTAMVLTCFGVSFRFIFGGFVFMPAKNPPATNMIIKTPTATIIVCLFVINNSTDIYSIVPKLAQRVNLKGIIYLEGKNLV